MNITLVIDFMESSYNFSLSDIYLYTYIYIYIYMLNVLKSAVVVLIAGERYGGQRTL